jgi:hypothetical protein
MSPYALKDKPVMTRFYYITDSNKAMPPIPSSNAMDKWTRLFIEAKANGDCQLLRTMTAKQQKLWDNVDCEIHDYKIKYFQDVGNASQDIACSSHEGHHPLHELQENRHFSLDYWQSNEAKNLFSPDDSDKSVEDALDECIELQVLASRQPKVIWMIYIHHLKSTNSFRKQLL